MTLKAALIDEIRRSGPISVAEYMTRCLYDPKEGYYTRHAEIGRSGDFTTAPELSQMFGELIGLALAQSWIDQGGPEECTLLELGPGRGTLMRDILRATQKVPGFHAAVNICLLEVNAKFRLQQRDALRGYDIAHIESLEGLAQNPCFVIANEYFDCLPIHQYRKTQAGWQEVMVDVDQGASDLGFTLGRAFPTNIPGHFHEAGPAAQAQISALSAHIARFGGALLVIDYGDWGSSEADTLQAIKSHRKCDPLEGPGLSDLTAHVDFHALRLAAGELKAGYLAQGAFLLRLGLEARAKALSAHLSGAALEAHESAYQRLSEPDQMGGLFKVLGLVPEGAPMIAGLEGHDA